MSGKSALSGLKIGVIGAGNMGQALVRGLVEKSVYPQNISIFDVDKKKLDAIKKEAHVKIAKSNRQCVSLSDVVILAVKPQMIQQVVEEIASGLDKDALVISIAAALVGSGMSAFSLGKHATQKHRKIAEGILGAFGEITQVPEKWLDLVTAVSGSGPAYFFLLTEKLIEAAYEMGMKVDVAKKIVYQTAFGSGKVLMQSQEDPEVLIDRVSSKGGTTEAALKVFQKQGLGKIVQDAVKAAYKRSKEISQGR